MAIKDSTYAGRFTIPTPKGVYQAAGDTNVNADYAYKAENMRTERGLLATSCGTSRAFPSLGYPIETLERFHRRSRPDDPDVFVAGAGGCVYTYTMGTEGWIQRADGFEGNRWSCVTYEAVENGETVDILIMSNAQDGMIAVYGSDLRVERKALTIGDDYAEVRFAVLGRYAERIWGTGAPGYPDNIFYSRPYDPFNWTDVPETPELGGGMIQQPTWDGDAFLSIVPFGGYLLAVKPHTALRSAARIRRALRSRRHMVRTDRCSRAPSAWTGRTYSTWAAQVWACTMAARWRCSRAMRCMRRCACAWRQTMKRGLPACATTCITWRCA